MGAGELLADAVERRPMGTHDGRSGSTLERIRLADGTRLVLKRSVPGVDLVGQLMRDHATAGCCSGDRSSALHAGFTGDVDRELALVATGVLDTLPAGIGHAIVDAWRDGADVLVLMRDVGEYVPGWTCPLDRADGRRVLGAAASMHDAFRGRRVDGLCDLAERLTLLWPHRMAALTGMPNPLPGLVLRGWRRFAELVEPRVAGAVRALQDDPSPLVDALAAYPHTLLHGDLWLVNLALEPGQVTLLDWGAASWAPPVVEFASFLVGNAGHIRASRDDIIADYLAVAGSWQDETGLRLGLVTGLMELGWNKALDAVEHPDPHMRMRERADLEWWLDATAAGLAELGLP